MHATNHIPETVRVTLVYLEKPLLLHKPSRHYTKHFRYKDFRELSTNKFLSLFYVPQTQQNSGLLNGFYLCVCLSVCLCAHLIDVDAPGAVS